MFTVKDCIDELNEKNCFDSQFKVSEIGQILEKAIKIKLNKESVLSKITNFFVSFYTVIHYEKVFYETQSGYARTLKTPIIDELKDKVVPKKLITKDFQMIDLWDINPCNSNKYIIFCEGISSEKSLVNQQNAYLQMIQNGYGVAAFNYRGRGFSSKEFSQQGAFLDVCAVYDYLRSKNIQPYNIGIIGHSMGTGVACDFSSKKYTAFTLLINPFTKASDMAKNITEKLNMPEIIKKTIKNFPSKFIPLKNVFDNEKTLKSINSPVFIIHNTDDKTIPVSQARTLFQKIKNKGSVFYKELPGDDHEINREKIHLGLSLLKRHVCMP